MAATPNPFSHSGHLPMSLGLVEPGQHRSLPDPFGVSAHSGVPKASDQYANDATLRKTKKCGSGRTGPRQAGTAVLAVVGGPR